MKDIICDVCFEEYKSTEGFLPRQLECGHSCCTNCLIRLMQSSRSCMKCRKPLTKSAVQEYPVNYCLQEAVETLDSSTNSQKDVKAFVKDSLADLLGIVEGENEPIEKINSLEENIKKLSEQLTTYKDPKQDLLLTLDTAKNKEDFLSEIAIRVRCGEEIYAVTELNDTTKFAKLSASNDSLFIHALQEGADLVGRTRNFVAFNDLKRSSEKNIRAFIIVPRGDNRNQTLSIKLQDSSRVQEFIRLCTGEAQTCLKNMRYVQGSPTLFVEYRHDTLIPLPFKSVFKVENAGSVMTPSSCFDYVIAEERETALDNDSMVCVMDPDRSFRVLGTSIDVSIKNVVGIIENTSLLSTSDFYSNISYRAGSYIQDCGIIIHVNRPGPLG